MLDIFRHLLARIKGPEQVVPTSQGIALAERILLEKIYSPQLAAAVARKSLYERWELVNALLYLKPNPACHFLHVPKTGGTTFGETLGKDKKVVILSVDASPDTLAKQLVRFANVDNQKMVLTRAHHSLALVYNSGSYRRFKMIFSAYRRPEDIHISNVNMIMRRVQCYRAGQAQPDAELQFSEEWLSAIRQPFEYSVEYAYELLTSDEYMQKMGGVYERFFNARGWQNMVKSKRILVIDARDFDALLTDGFGYENPPGRRNVSLQPLLTSTDVSEEDIEPLIAPDREIVSFLQQHLSGPEQLIERLFGGKHQVDN